MRTLGLDLGTNSIGWALLESNGRQKQLIAKGVQIFEKGVGEEKNTEYSLASQRTMYRSARKLKRRRKWRKQETLKVLIKHQMCPGITEEAVLRWQKENASSAKSVGKLRFREIAHCMK